MGASGASCPRIIWLARRRESGSIGTCSVPADQNGAVSAGASIDEPSAFPIGFVPSHRSQGVFKMRHSQRGVTFIGWLLLLIPIAILVYCGIRITPMYLNFLNVSKALNQVATQAKSSSSISAQELKTSLEKNFDVQAIERPSPKDIEVHRGGENLT